MKRRVIFVPDDYWTDPPPKENTMSDDDPTIDLIRNCPPAVVPPDTIHTWAENMRVLVIGAPDRTLMLALHLTMPGTLGDVQCHLGREQIIELHTRLDDLVNLTAEQLDALVDRACQEDGA